MDIDIEMEADSEEPLLFPPLKVKHNAALILSQTILKSKTRRRASLNTNNENATSLSRGKKICTFKNYLKCAFTE